MRPCCYHGHARCLARKGVLLALALTLSYLEAMLPLNLLIPLPGVKLGLANVATLASLYLLDPSSVLSLTLLRCLLGAAFGGGWMSLLFSLSGGMLSTVVMAAAKHLPWLSIYGVSLLGAAAHGIGQIASACLLTATAAVAAYLPLLLLAGMATGLAIAGMAAGVLRSLTRIHIRP